MVHLVESLHRKRKELRSIPRTHMKKPGVVARAYNPRPAEVEMGGFPGAR